MMLLWCSRCGGVRGAELSPSQAVLASSSPGSLLLLHLLVFFALFFKPCRSQPLATCGVTLVRGGEAASLTCKMSSLRPPKNQSRLLVKRFNDTDDIVNLAVCTWQGTSYGCTANFSDVSVKNVTSNNSNSNNNNDWWSQQVTLGLPPYDLKAAFDKHAYHYICFPDGMDPKLCTFPPVRAPDAPVLKVTQTTTTIIEVSWDCDQDGVIPLLGFELNYTRGHDEDWQSIQLKPDNTSFTATGLLCGTLYRFVARAFNVIGFSLGSQVIEVRTNGSVPVLSSRCPFVKEINVTTATLDFTGLKAGAGCPITFISVKYRPLGNMSWSGVMENVSTDVVTREVTVDDLTPDSRYMMRITAHSDAGDTSCSLRFTTPPLPQVETETKEEETDPADRHGMIIAVIAMACVLLVIISTAVVVLCRRCRRTRQRGRNNHQLSPMLAADAEMESPADHISLHDQDAMLQEEE